MGLTFLTFDSLAIITRDYEAFQTFLIERATIARNDEVFTESLRKPLGERYTDADRKLLADMRITL
jgi:hypothetical protein